MFLFFRRPPHYKWSPLKFTPKSSELAFGACTAWPISENDSEKLFTIFFFAVRHNDEFRLGKSCSGIFHAIYFFHDINQIKTVGGLFFPPTELREKRFGNVRNDGACFSCLFQFLPRSNWFQIFRDILIQLTITENNFFSADNVNSECGDSVNWEVLRCGMTSNAANN